MRRMLWPAKVRWDMTQRVTTLSPEVLALLNKQPAWWWIELDEIKHNTLGVPFCVCPSGRFQWSGVTINADAYWCEECEGLLKQRVK